ncbi:MAG: hypothetical protein LBL73_03840 [Synergistaceae bacterium]|nr:hypothetical protein [Synergistaceae bacterium]
MNVVSMSSIGMKVLNAMSYHQKEVSKSLERLSTGLRINRAADDPAGMAMAQRMTAEVSGARQAAKNVAMGQDMARSADSVLANIQDALHRFRELAVYAASDTLTDGDRAYIQDEAEQLTEYINNLIGGSKFNKIKLFATDTLAYFEKNAISLVAKNDAEAQTLRLSVGKLIEQGLVMENIYTSVFSYLENYVEEKKSEDGFEDQEIKFDKDKISLKILNIDDIDLSTLEKATSNLHRVNDALARVSDYVAVPDAPAETSGEFDAALGQNLALNYAFQSTFDSVRQSLAAQRTETEKSEDDEEDSDSYAAIRDVTSEARADFLAATGGDALISGVQSVLDNLGADKKDGNQGKYWQLAGLHGENIFTIQSGPDEGETYLLNLGRISAASLGLYGIDFSTRETSAESLSRIDDALEAVSSQRAMIGAQINGMDHTIENLENYATNLESARSRIMDADIPAEMMNFTKHSLQYQIASQMLKAVSDIETRAFQALF